MPKKKITPDISLYKKEKIFLSKKTWRALQSFFEQQLAQSGEVPSCIEHVFYISPPHDCGGGIV